VRAFFSADIKKRCLLTHTEAKKRAIFSVLRSKKAKILGKSRAARTTKAIEDHENQDFTFDIGKSERPCQNDALNT
jgi:IS30 family transposase